MDQMPIRAKPYAHQIEAYNLACRLFGLVEGGDDDDTNMRDMQETDSPEAKPNKEI